MSELDPYAQFVAQRFKKMGGLKEDLMHAAAGLSGEAGEFIDAVKKLWAYGKPLDEANAVEELGDALFYIQAACNVLQISMQDVIRTNVEKLTKRYPKGYTDADAIARADKQ